MSRGLEEFHLDKIYESLKLLNKKHADKAYVSRNLGIIILVEETSTARKEDVDKLVETLQTIKVDKRFMEIFRVKSISSTKFIVALHAKSSTSLISKYLLSEGKKRGVTVLTASCEEDFRNKLKSMNFI